MTLAARIFLTFISSFRYSIYVTDIYSVFHLHLHGYVNQLFSDQLPVGLLARTTTTTRFDFKLFRVTIDSFESFILPFFTRKVSTVTFSEGGYTLSRSPNDKTSNTHSHFDNLSKSRSRSDDGYQVFPPK